MESWGDMVFSSSEILFAWNVRFADETVMPGVYVFRIEIVYSTGGNEFSEVLSGDATVIR